MDPITPYPDPNAQILDKINDTTYVIGSFFWRGFRYYSYTEHTGWVLVWDPSEVNMSDIEAAIKDFPERMYSPEVQNLYNTPPNKD